MHRTLPACAPVLLLLAACETGSAGSAAFTIRDSAGIHLAESTAPAWREGEGWRLSPQPALAIGAEEGDPKYQFAWVAGVHRLGDGRIAVADGETNDLRIFGADGKYLRSVGRKGGGPGEFEGLSWLEAGAGDSLVTYDWGNARVSVFTPDGEFVRSFPFERPATGFPFPVALYRDGSLLARIGVVYRAGESKSGVRRDSIYLVRYRRDGTLRDTLGRFPGSEALLRAKGRSLSVASLPFGRSPAMAVHGGRTYYGASDRYEIGVYEGPGAPERLIRREYANLEVTPEDVERYKQEQLESAGAQGRQSVERMLAEVPFPKTMPAYATFLVDEPGNLWVRDYDHMGAESAHWTVFDPEGRMLGSVEMPRQFRVQQIGTDFVLGIATDDLGVQQVRLYRLAKGKAAAA